MDQIAQASLRGLFSSVGSDGLGSGLVNGLSSLVSSLFGSPGRATGGPVSAGRPYVIGERGPELFVPSGAGRIEQIGGGPRNVSVGITIQSPTPSDPQVLRQSSRQVARSIRSALKASQ
jgi:phage-related minor tail protein